MRVKYFRFFEGNNIFQLDEPDRVYSDDEYTPEYYNTDEFVFIGVTPSMYDPEDFEPTKAMLFRHIEEGNTVRGEVIRADHPMWNYHTQE